MNRLQCLRTIAERLRANADACSPKCSSPDVAKVSAVRRAASDCVVCGATSIRTFKLSTQMSSDAVMLCSTCLLHAVGAFRDDILRDSASASPDVAYEQQWCVSADAAIAAELNTGTQDRGGEQPRGDSVDDEYDIITRHRFSVEESSFDFARSALFVNCVSLRSFACASTEPPTAREEHAKVEPMVCEGWLCPRCTLRNNQHVNLCSACGEANPQTTLRCPHCEQDVQPQVLNEKSTCPNEKAKGSLSCVLYCRPKARASACNRGATQEESDQRPSERQRRHAMRAFHAKAQDVLVSAHHTIRHQLWQCDVCTVVNTRETNHCEVCLATRKVHCPRCTFEENMKPVGTPHAPRMCCAMCSSTFELPVVEASLLPHSAKHNSPLLEKEWELELKRSIALDEGKKRLEKRIALLGGKIAHQASDGNCMFRSISFAVMGSADYHAAVREWVVNHMIAMSSFYGVFFDGELEFDRYVQGMLLAGTWGDGLCLHAAATLFGVPICVVSSEEMHWKLRFTPSPPEEEAKDDRRGPPVVLSYLSPVHYDAVISSASAMALDRDAYFAQGIVRRVKQLITDEREWADAPNC